VITLVLGGTRSGKSEIAERLALEAAPRVTYLATGVATDDDMAARIERHRERRDDRFTTVEVGSHLLDVLAGRAEEAVLVDSLGTWLAGSEAFGADVDALVRVLGTRTAATVLVSEEVGLGVHPSSDAGRVFRDALGELNRAVAAVADRALLVVAGRVLPLHPFSSSPP
jgi:adenosyl cobinamide kinase/adenosyl cobinamide phosphate guanylyltransferase